MMQRLLGGGFGRAIATGAGSGIGAELIQNIFWHHQQRSTAQPLSRLPPPLTDQHGLAHVCESVRGAGWCVGERLAAPGAGCAGRDLVVAP